MNHNKKQIQKAIAAVKSATKALEPLGYVQVTRLLYILATELQAHLLEGTNDPHK